MDFDFFSLITLDPQCLIIDSKEINPIEIWVITNQEKKINKYIMEKKLDDFGNGDIRRIVRVYSVKKIKIINAKKTIEKIVHKLGNEVSKWPDADYRKLLQYYFLFSKNNFVKKLLSLYLGISDNNVSEITIQINTFLSEYNSQIDIRKKRKQDLFDRIRHKLVLERISWRVRIHNVFTRKRFFNYLNEHFNCDEGQLVNISSKSGTDCVLMKQITSHGTFFIKGNAPRICNLKHEIKSQKRINLYYPTCTQFVKFVECDKKNEWILYPYENGVSLREYCKEYVFNIESLDNLGCFLLDVIKKLKNIRIIHSDIRPENILVYRTENTEEFRLIDFGGAAIDEKIQWTRNNGIDRYYKRIIGGKYRYDDEIIDDAASAILTYIEAGGKLSDKFGQKLLCEVGSYYVHVR